MRIPSGTTNRYIYFVAVDSADLSTRETGLSSFTVYYEIANGTATAMTTPTVTEADATNMPGVYSLLIDESGMTTLTSGHDTAELVLHITQASMAPVTRVIEIYRVKATEGNTLDVTSTGAAGIDWGNVENPTTAVNLSGTNIDTDQVVASVTGAVGSVTGAVGSVTGNVGGNVTGSVGSVAADGITATSIAANAIDADALAADAGTEIGTAVWATATRTLTAGTNIVLPANGLSNVTAWTVAITGDITGNLSGSVGSVTGTVGGIAGTITTLDALDTAQDSQHAQTQSDIAALNNAPAVTASSIADAVWDEVRSGHVTQGTYGESFSVIVKGTVSNAVTTPSTTEFAADDITEATGSHYNGRTIIFTTGALTGQATDITAYSLVSSEGKFTVTALTEAPANNDQFIII